MDMVCGKCGANMADGMQFCTVCGNSLEAKSAPTVQNYYAPVVKGGGNSVFGIILMIVGAVVALYGVGYTIYTAINASTYSAYVTFDFFAIASMLINAVGVGLILMGVGAVLNKLAKR